MHLMARTNSRESVKLAKHAIPQMKREDLHVILQYYMPTVGRLPRAAQTSPAACPERRRDPASRPGCLF